MDFEVSTSAVYEAEISLLEQQLSNARHALAQRIVVINTMQAQISELRAENEALKLPTAGETAPLQQ